MIELEKEVPSIEVCKRLKEIGFPQENGGWHWVITEKHQFKPISWALKFYDNYEDIPYWAIHVKAPTFQEIGMWFIWLIENNSVKFDKEVQE